jgi:Fe2+ transport system protein B
MPEIKTKEFINANETFDTVSDLGDRMRRGLAKSTDRARPLTEDGQGSSTEYASDQFQNTAEDIGYEAGHIVVDTAKGTSKTIREATESFLEHRRSEPPRIHRKPSETQRVTKFFKKAETTAKQTTDRTAQRAVKDSQRAVKVSQEATRLSVKTAQETARAAERSARIAAETARKTAEAAKAAAKAAAEAAKAAAKAVVAAGKAIAAAVEELVAAIASGGWIALVVIAVIIIIIVIIIAVVGYLDPSVTTPQ